MCRPGHMSTTGGVSARGLGTRGLSASTSPGGRCGILTSPKEHWDVATSRPGGHWGVYTSPGGGFPSPSSSPESFDEYWWRGRRHLWVGGEGEIFYTVDPRPQFQGKLGEKNNLFVIFVLELDNYMHIFKSNILIC